MHFLSNYIQKSLIDLLNSTRLMARIFTSEEDYRVRIDRVLLSYSP